MRTARALATTTTMMTTTTTTMVSAHEPDKGSGSGGGASAAGEAAAERRRDNRVRRTSRKRRNQSGDDEPSKSGRRNHRRPIGGSQAASRTTTTTMATATNCNCGALDRVRAALPALLLLPLLITALGALTLAAPAAAAPAAASAAAQQRQLQRQQLFALLSSSDAAAASGLMAQPRHALQSGDGDGGDAASLEITGFVADDGQQYQKAVRAAQGGGGGHKPPAGSGDESGGGGGGNCPKECTCLDSYFDCGKKYLTRVPQLPGYVQHLDLVGNNLNETTALQIQNLAKLQKLSLRRNQLAALPLFVGLGALRQLNLAHNRIERLSDEALAALPRLKTLDLSRNHLRTLDGRCFPAHSRLAHLNLNGNELASIDERALEPLGELLDLELSNNRLHTLPAGVFKSLAKLRKLSLNANQLEINWSTFRGLVALQKLYLRANNIRGLQDGVFHVMRAIEEIDLDHNGITSLGRQGLFNLTKLQLLSLANNSIARIEPDTWEFTQSLVWLDLSHNNISEFRPQHLECLQRLQTLNLGHNKIQYLADTTFDCVKNLEELNLRRNKLAWSIEDAAGAPPFKALRKLKRLDLHGNNLKQLNGRSLSGLASLEALNLGGNALASVQTGTFDATPHLHELTFKSLNFICDCELLWFRRWLQRNAQAQATGTAGEQQQLEASAVCGYPEHLLDRELLSLKPAELICADDPKPVITQEPSNQLAVKGANVTMECIAVSPAAAALAATDELKIKWRHDNQLVRSRPIGGGGGGGGASHYSTTETQVQHDADTNRTMIVGYLRLHNVSYESAGRFQCVVSNAFGTTYSQKFKVSIGIHPTFLQIPSNLTIDSGETARLVCSATGDPMPEMALQKFGGSDFPAATERRLQVIREENAFVITNAKPIDTGIYTCTADSAAGEVRINASLIVNDKPQPEIPRVRKETVQGESSVLECLLHGGDLLERPQLHRREWFKDNKPFHTSSVSVSERYYFTAAKELLIIVDTQPADAGHYRCALSDDAKTFAMQTELVVVKADLNGYLVILAAVAVTLLCLVLSLAVGCALCLQRRKSLQPAAGGARIAIAPHSHDGGGGGGGGSVLDQTQLTALNGTTAYLQQAAPHHGYRTPPSSRPHSLADLEPHLNGNRVIIGGGATHYAVDGVDALMFARSLHDLEHNQDLSSKDSGTGSDAAVQTADEPAPSAQRRASLAQAETSSSSSSDDDDDGEGNGRHDDSAAGMELCALKRERRRDSRRYRHNNNRTPTPDGAGGGGGGGGRGVADDAESSAPLLLPPAAAKHKIQSSTKFGAAASAPGDAVIVSPAIDI